MVRSEITGRKGGKACNGADIKRSGVGKLDGGSSYGFIHAATARPVQVCIASLDSAVPVVSALVTVILDHFHASPVTRKRRYASMQQIKSAPPELVFQDVSYQGV